MSCTLCELHSTARSVLVPFRGQFRQPKIMFVGIGPGQQEDADNRCFSGPSGELLNDVLTELNIPQSAVAYDNIVHCWPRDLYGQTRDPSSDEILTCSPFLWNMLKMVDPTVVVPLGTLAYRTITGQNEAYITEAHGVADKIRVGCKDRYVVGTFHPSAALRQNKRRGIPQSYYDGIVRDIKYAWDHANGEYFLPKARIINDTREAIQYIEMLVDLYQRGLIKFAAMDTEGPQIQLKQKDRKKLGIEVQSSDMWLPHKRTVGISLSYIPPNISHFREVEGVFIVMDHPESKVDYEQVSWALKWAFDREGQIKIPVAYQNQKYDDQWTRQKHDLRTICYHDSMLGSFVLHGHSISHGLGNITHKLLKYENYKDGPGEYLETLPLDQRSFYNVPLAVLGPYAAYDAAGTASLAVVEKNMLRRSNQEMVNDVLTEGTTNFADIEFNGAAIDYEKHQQHMKNYPDMMDVAKKEVMELPMVVAYIWDRQNIWTVDQKGKPRKPDKKFQFNPNSPPQRYDLLYRYYNFPIEYAEETKASQDHEDDNDYVAVFSTNENSRHMMTLHVRDEKYEGKCTCRSFVPGWDTFGQDEHGNRWRTWDYYHPVNFLHYDINPHAEGYKFLIKIRFWGKLRKVYNDYLKKIENYFRPMEWQRTVGIPENLRIVNNNYILHWVKCVARGSEIDTDEGKVPIEQLYQRFTEDEFKRLPKILDGVIYRYPLEVVYSGFKPSVTITALDTWGDYHTLTGSYHHMVRTQRSFVSESGWKRLDRFSVDDVVVICIGPCHTRYAKITTIEHGEAEFFDISMDAAHDTFEEVECRVCGHQSQLLTKHLRVYHDLTVAQYLDMYPGVPVSSDLWNQDKSQRLSRTLKQLWATSEFRDFISTDSRQVAVREIFKRPEVRKANRDKRTPESYQSPKQKAAASLTISRLNLAGEGVFKKQRRYEYTDIKGRHFVFKSSFEIAYAFYLDSLNCSWDYESQTLRYDNSGGYRGRYTPDFCVEGKIVEIKPEWLHEKTQLFLDTYFAEHNIRLVGETELTELGAFQLYYDSIPKAAVGADLAKNAFYGPKLKYGYVANGFICHNTGRLCTRDFAIHTVPWHCLSGSTKVRLLSGEEPSIADITCRFFDGEEFWVYSVDDDTDRVVPGKVVGAQVTHLQAPLIRVWFDNGSCEDVTPEHEFRTRNRGYVQAQNLTPNDSISPLYLKDDGNGYEMLYDLGSGKFVYTTKIEHLEGIGQVYDLQIEKYHNFALASGVFVHNSDPRRLFVSRWKNTGGLMLSADYSQLELRVAASIGKDEKLIELYRQGKDVHRATAAKVYKVPENEVTQAMRRYSKTMSFRLIYGGGAQAIADETGLTKPEAQKMIDAFLAEYKGVAKSIEDFHDHVTRLGYVWTPMRRIFYLPDIFEENNSKRAGALRDSQNYPIQCFVASTKIKLLDGTKPNIADLTDRERFWVYSFDVSRKKVVPGLAKNCRKTGERAPVYEVKLDNGTSERCTGDHLWLLKSGDYCKTVDLKSGESLEPLITGNVYGYETVWDQRKTDVPRLVKRLERVTTQVVSVEFVGYDDVYDFEVENYHNFALADSGVIVHNSSSSDVTMTAINMVCRELPKTGMRSLIWAMIHDAIESDLYPGELLPYYKILKRAMEEQVCELYEWLCVPMVAEFELGVRWDGALTVKELDDQHMILKGRRGFYDETLEHLARGYQFECKIKKEVYTGTHIPCKGDGEVDAVTKVCKKCGQVVNPETDLDYGETLILRKSYEGESGGNTEVTCEITWRQFMELTA